MTGPVIGLLAPSAFGLLGEEQEEAGLLLPLGKQKSTEIDSCRLAAGREMLGVAGRGKQVIPVATNIIRL